MEINWQTFAAVLGASTASAVAIGAVCVWVTRAVVGNFIQKSNSQLLALINGTYLRSGGSKSNAIEFEHRLHELEEWRKSA